MKNYYRPLLFLLQGLAIIIALETEFVANDVANMAKQELKMMSSSEGKYIISYFPPFLSKALILMAKTTMQNVAPMVFLE